MEIFRRAGYSGDGLQENAMTTRLSVALVLTLWCALAAGQGQVYESQDKAGPVFSDRPTPGAKPIEVSPPNVIQTTPVPRQAAPAASAPYYTALAVSSPGNGATVHTNTGAFDVRIQAAPALRTGDRIRVTLDGTRLQRGFGSTSIRVTESDWQAAAGAGKEMHTLQTAIVDQSGAVVIQSPAVSFYVRRATVQEGGGRR
jgi:hypothetical protein